MYRRWVFTLNNYTDEEVDQLNHAAENDNGILFLAYAKEIGDNGTPHLQGFIRTKCCRLSWLKRNLNGRAHYEKCMATTEQALRYIKGPWTSEDGTKYKPVNDSFIYFGVLGNQGKRSDLQKFMEDVDSGLDTRELIQKHPSVLARARHFFHEYICLYNNTQLMGMWAKMYESVVWKDWQKKILKKMEDHFKKPPNSFPTRNFHYYYEKTGGVGKTFLTRYLETHHNAFVLKGIGQVTANYLIKPGTKVIVVDVPRSAVNGDLNSIVNGVDVEKVKVWGYIMNWIEQILDGKLVSSKYEPLEKWFFDVFLIVFSNDPFDWWSMISQDRPIIEEIEE